MQIIRLPNTYEIYTDDASFPGLTSDELVVSFIREAAISLAKFFCKHIRLNYCKAVLMSHFEKKVHQMAQMTLNTTRS